MNKFQDTFDIEGFWWFPDKPERKIPELCHADLLSKLGYDVVWNNLDPNNAKIIKKIV